MIIRNLDTAGDWRIGRGKQDFLTGLNALKLDLKTRLKSWRGDCFYSTGDGVDWNNYLDIGTKDLLDRDIKRVTLQTPGILKIKSYESTLNRESRGLTVTMEISTVFGDLDLTEVL